jgi:hypothetical protein
VVVVVVQDFAPFIAKNSSLVPQPPQEYFLPLAAMAEMDLLESRASTWAEAAEAVEAEVDISISATLKKPDHWSQTYSLALVETAATAATAAAQALAATAAMVEMVETSELST